MIWKERLKNYKDLKLEVLELEQKKNQASTQSDIGTVQRSLHTFPYTKGTASVQLFTKEYKKLERQYNKQLQKLLDELSTIEEFIAEIPDSETRRLIKLYYIDMEHPNLDWADVARLRNEQLGIKGIIANGNREKNKVHRYLEKCDVCDENLC